MGRIRRGWLLTRKSWFLVRRERKLLVFPALSALLALLAAAAIFGGAAALGWDFASWRTFALFALFAYPLQFISTFFGVAFVAMGRRSLDGEEVTVGAGIECARKRLRAIALWSALATGVGLALQALQHVRGDWAVSKLASVLLGLAWSAVAFFAVPVVALEGTGARETVRRSARLFKQRWGEEFTGATALTSVAMVFALVLGVAGGIVGAVAVSVPAVGVPLLIAVGAVAIVLFAIWAAVLQMFSLVLYRYATSEAAYGAFAGADLERAFERKPRSRLMRLLRR